ncbi:MAG: transcriptional regulator NrdR [Gammaproteobacteria bacterium]|nr:transcriptional regulator NrdR [Gammaproteobacteria bacterium]
MHCPFCPADDTKVIDSRLITDSNQIRRRRQCMACSERFNTYEVAELAMPKVIKSDNSRVAFDDKKLRSGLEKALEKRPVSVQTIEAIINRIKVKIRTNGEPEINAKKIGQWLMTELYDVNQVAYVRFASVYRSFQDINAFNEEIKKLQQSH